MSTPKVLSDLQELHAIRETPQADQNKFDWELQEHAKAHPISYRHLVEYCLWIVKQNPKALMPWEPGFETERAERVLKNTMKPMKIANTLQLASQFIQEQGGIITTLMTDKEIRHQAQKRGWWYAASIVSGPAHIILRDGCALCDPLLSYDTRLSLRSRRLCKKCAKAAQKVFESENT